MSGSLWPHGLGPARLLCPWDFPGKNTAVGCHFLLQGIFQTQGLNLGSLHCRQTLYHLSHQGRLTVDYLLCMHMHVPKIRVWWASSLVWDNFPRDCVVTSLVPSSCDWHGDHMVQSLRLLQQRWGAGGNHIPWMRQGCHLKCLLFPKHHPHVELYLP